jgi:hypothetical protein
METMNIKLLAAAAAAATAIAGVASAQTAPVYNPSVTVNLAGNVPSICGVRFNLSANNSETLTFANLASTPAASQLSQSIGVSALCNSANGYNVSYASTNGGYLVLGGTATTDNSRRIRWTLQGSNPGRGGFGDEAQLTSVQTRQSGAFLTSASTNMTIRVNGVQVQDAGNPGNPAATTTNVFAGDYSDVLTVSVAAR